MKGNFDACISLLSCNKGELFLHHIVMHDEKWILYDNLKHSAQWLDKDEVPKHSSKLDLSGNKLMGITQGVIQ